MSAGMSAGWAVMSDRVEVVARKLAMLRRFEQDLGHYADLDQSGRQGTRSPGGCPGVADRERQEGNRSREN